MPPLWRLLDDTRQFYAERTTRRQLHAQERRRAGATLLRLSKSCLCLCAKPKESRIRVTSGASRPPSPRENSDRPSSSPERDDRPLAIRVVRVPVTHEAHEVARARFVLKLVVL